MWSAVCRQPVIAGRQSLISCSAVLMLQSSTPVMNCADFTITQSCGGELPYQAVIQPVSMQLNGTSVETGGKSFQPPEKGQALACLLDKCTKEWQGVECYHKHTRFLQASSVS